MTVQTTHYHIGWNMPGYLPEMEPWIVWGSEEDARRAIAHEILYHADQEGNAGDEDAAEELDALAQSTNYCRANQGWDGWTDRLHYWITPCSDECEEEES